jgi:hypothetical protein
VGGTTSNGGEAGIGSGGDFNAKGGPGHQGSAVNSFGGNPMGGNSFFQGGGKGVNGTGVADISVGVLGGGGAAVSSTSAGGAGGSGIVIVTEYA